MLESNDYKYLEKCFESIDGKLDTVIYQVTATNNRVNKLEDKSNERQVVINDFRHLESEFKVCKEKIEEIDKNLLEVWFFKKYPKIFVGVIVVAIFTAIALVKVDVNKLKDMVHVTDQKVDLINVPMRTRGGSVVLVPSGVYMDSLNNIKK